MNRTLPPAQKAPVVCCVACGQVLDAQFQSGGGYFPDRWYITCQNLTCDLWAQTATPDSYPFENLESYLSYGRAHRGERILMQLERLQPGEKLCRQSWE